MLINLTSPRGQINNINPYIRIREWLNDSKQICLPLYTCINKGKVKVRVICGNKKHVANTSLEVIRGHS